MKTRIKWLSPLGLTLALATTSAALAADELPSKSAAETNSRQPLIGTDSAQSTTPVPAAVKPQESRPAATSAAPAVDRTLSLWAAETLKLVQSGIKEDVVLSFIDSAGTFNLSAQQIISLTQSGVPKDLITAMIQHDHDVLTGVRQVSPSSASISPLGVFLADAAVPAQSSAPAQQKSVPPPPQFVMPPPSLVVFADEEWSDPPEMRELSPVRKPYPEKLTDPIIVWNIPTRLMCRSCR
jgi:hypothetical protein